MIYSLKTWLYDIIWALLWPQFSKIWPHHLQRCKCTHMPIHGKWRYLNTSYASDMNVRCRVGWLTASKRDTMISFGLTLHGIIGVRRCTYMPIHDIWRCSNTSHTSSNINMDVRCRVGWFTALKHDHMISFGLTLTPKFLTFGHPTCMQNCVRCTHFPIHCIWMCWNTSYTTIMYVGCW